MSEMGFGSPGAMFQQEKLWEQRIATKILTNMRAISALRKGVDPQLDGLFNQIPPPPELVEAKVWLRYRMSIAKSKELKRVIAMILKYIIKLLLDLFRKDAVLVPSYWKDEATSPSEREYISAPGKVVPDRDEFEKELDREIGIGSIETEESISFEDSKREGEIYDKAKLSFLGPAGDEDDDVSEDDTEEEDLDV
jgi:hypothetical protein